MQASQVDFKIHPTNNRKHRVNEKTEPWASSDSSRLIVRRSSPFISYSDRVLLEGRRIKLLYVEPRGTAEPPRPDEVVDLLLIRFSVTNLLCSRCTHCFQLQIGPELILDMSSELLVVLIGWLCRQLRRLFGDNTLSQSPTCYQDSGGSDDVASLVNEQEAQKV